MSWGDSWGHGPCKNARKLAKAFYEGRERRMGQSCVRFHEYKTRIEYHYNGAVIAWYTPDTMVPRLVAEKLATGRCAYLQHWPLQFRAWQKDKGEARHLQALGLEAKWQWGGRPFLIFGADTHGQGWLTLDEWKALPKWVEPPAPVKPPRPERFVNLTMPLFA